MSLDQYGTEMEPEAMTAFLESQGIGTIGFGNEDGGYCLPMSFGYDSFADRCIFQFAFGADSRKVEYITADNRVTLSVHDWNSVTDWQSVVLRGPLAEIPDDEQSKAAGIFAAHAEIASLDVFRQPLEDLDLDWYALHVEEKHGRRATP